MGNNFNLRIFTIVHIWTIYSVYKEDIYMYWYPYYQLINAVTEKKPPDCRIRIRFVGVTVLYFIHLSENSIKTTYLFGSPNINRISVYKITATIHACLKKKKANAFDLRA